MTDYDHITDQPDRSEPNDQTSQVMDSLEQDSRVERIPRMTTAAIAENRSLTDDERIAAIRNIKTYIDRDPNLTQAKLAKMAGVSKSAVSELVTGSYKGDRDRVIRSLEAAINELMRRKDAPEHPKFVQTKVAKRIFSIIKLASKSRTIGVIYCPSGAGKSMALKASIELDFPSAILVEGHPGCASPLNFCRAVIPQLTPGRNNFDNVRSRADAFNLIVRYLKNSSRLIIVDEADCLQTETLSLIRYLHDATGDDDNHCPVILCGRPNLAAKINRTVKNEEIGGSLRGRIGVEQNLLMSLTHNPKSGGDNWLFTIEEIIQILAKAKITITADAARWLCTLANLSLLDGIRELGGLRYAIKVASLAQAANPNQRLTVDMLRAVNYITRDFDGATMINNQIESHLKRQRRTA